MSISLIKPIILAYGTCGYLIGDLELLLFFLFKFDFGFCFYFILKFLNACSSDMTDSVCKLLWSSKKAFIRVVFYYVLINYSNFNLKESKSSSQEERADWVNFANF